MQYTYCGRCTIHSVEDAPYILWVMHHTYCGRCTVRAVEDAPHILREMHQTPWPTKSLLRLLEWPARAVNACMMSCLKLA
eukprot:1140339-Pelagomonas_calceolata.AAC.5